LPPGFSRFGNIPPATRRSVRTMRASGMKVTTNSLRRYVDRGAPDSASTRSSCRLPSHTCQMRALDMAPEDDDTTKVPT